MHEYMTNWSFTISIYIQIVSVTCCKISISKPWVKVALVILMSEFIEKLKGG